jgi:tetratricopeptide (TPR) repeat protein
MPTDPEQLLQKAVQLFSAAKFKEAFKSSEQARALFQKAGQRDRAMEALRVMADSALNSRDTSQAAKLYQDLNKEGTSASSSFYQSAAQWGMGQIALRKMDYSSAAVSFKSGLDLSKKTGDKWYSAWNALGLATAYRGTGQAADARGLLQGAASDFRSIGQPKYASWADKILTEIGGTTVAQPSKEPKPWLCPMCGSKLTADQADSLRSGKLITCEYCGTPIG